MVALLLILLMVIKMSCLAVNSSDTERSLEDDMPSSWCYYALNTQKI